VERRAPSRGRVVLLLAESSSCTDAAVTTLGTSALYSTLPLISVVGEHGRHALHGFAPHNALAAALTMQTRQNLPAGAART